MHLLLLLFFFFFCYCCFCRHTDLLLVVLPLLLFLLFWAFALLKLMNLFVLHDECVHDVCVYVCVLFFEASLIWCGQNDKINEILCVWEKIHKVFMLIHGNGVNRLYILYIQEFIVRNIKVWVHLWLLLFIDVLTVIKKITQMWLKWTLKYKYL